MASLAHRPEWPASAAGPITRVQFASRPRGPPLSQWALDTALGRLTVNVQALPRAPKSEKLGDEDGCREGSHGHSLEICDRVEGHLACVGSSVCCQSTPMPVAPEHPRLSVWLITERHARHVLHNVRQVRYQLLCCTVLPRHSGPAASRAEVSSDPPTEERVQATARPKAIDRPPLISPERTQKSPVTGWAARPPFPIRQAVLHLPGPFSHLFSCRLSDPQLSFMTHSH